MKKNFKIYLLFGAVIAVLLSIQMTGIISLFKINPDLLMILCILHSINKGEQKGEIFGFGVGLFEDIFSGEVFGFNAFILTFICWFTSIYRKFIFVADIVAYLIYVAIATILKYILFVILSVIFKANWIMDWMLLLNMGGEIVYNILIGMLFFYISPILYKKEEFTF
jgi:rod shape-determining protein MreD